MVTDEKYGVCRDHSDRAAISRCSRCGRYMCPACVVKGADIEGRLVCRRCLLDLSAANGLRRPVAWEARGRASWLSAFFATWREVVFLPRQFFASLEPGGGLLRPLAFAGICLGLGLLGSVWGWSGAARAVMGQLGSALGVIFVFSLAPFTYVAVFAATAAGLHLLALGFGGKASWRATVRVVSYSQAAAVAEVVPAIGGILALVLRLSLYGWGISAVHGFGTKRGLVFYGVLVSLLIGTLYFVGRLVTPFLPLLRVE